MTDAGNTPSNGNLPDAKSGKHRGPVLEFWFEFASTYSYLSAMRIETLAQEANVQLLWRPFLLGPIFKNLGWNTSPFNLQPAKGIYMWRDMERQCEQLGLPFSQPIPFPQNSLLSVRVAHAGRGQDWIGDFVRAVYMAQFGQGKDISDEALMADLLLEVGAPARDILEQAASPENKAALRETVGQAGERGIFGAPSFVTPDGELFWGNDRLEPAIDWAVRATR
ncbi:MAG: 2-hydroxychromene-2-carboxylate isomerase [Roseibium sp.]|uniref:2-hydroxychromene-2-carboxylate isomerase n=1 Tax=Roseibium sp. TaxID=1936156 RepID=UPI001B0C551A|nr:2-hydroxychromene-2-carboxylate isomerase [Roseibium sp.]MBO6892218.1 2-hydroxychromene-2-carboxylate isomerase [Roseibium sp.]MBO6930211.1 2-hydroxychromene-2-carboxylate isomerase [Roseibium sp.]